jgi:hypothetical protein
MPAHNGYGEYGDLANNTLRLHMTNNTINLSRQQSGKDSDLLLQNYAASTTRDECYLEFLGSDIQYPAKLKENADREKSNRPHRLPYYHQLQVKLQRSRLLRRLSLL